MYLALDFLEHNYFRIWFSSSNTQQRFFIFFLSKYMLNFHADFHQRMDYNNSVLVSKVLITSFEYEFV